jgi:ATP-binding cassette subfamily B multidrug efflux pump
MFKRLSEPFRYPKIPFSMEERKATKKGPISKSGTVKRIAKYLAIHKGILILVLTMVLLSSILGLLGPYLIGMAIDDFIVTKAAKGLWILLVELGIVYLFQSLTLWLQNYWMISIAQKTVFKMRTDLFSHLHKLPIPFFDQRQHGELMSRVTNDIENVSSTLNSSVIQIFSSIVTLIGTLSVMFWLSPSLTFITLLIVPIMFFGMKWITTRTGQFFKGQQRNLGNMNGFIQETISGQRIVKTFSQEQKVINEFRVKNQELLKTGFWAQTYSGFIPKLMNVLNNASFAVIAGVGGLFVLKGWITIGVIVIFTEYARQFTRPLNDLSNQLNTLLSSIAGAERVFEVLDEDEEVIDRQDTKTLVDARGEVEFKNVSFSYEKGGNTVKHINFHVNPGETVALVGPTGAGKTTMINLLSRFYEVDSGSIWFDGNEIKEISRGSLLANMGFVLQDAFLFQDTVRENIRYGRLDATDEEVEEAAKLANAHSFIVKLTNQYDQVLNQEGANISQGQKQLLSIARAILANPAMLILDEATSSIDTITEMKIQEALERLMGGRTSFVIAHRLNTIKNADRILVLENGEIIENGTHDELLDSEAFYYDLYHSQLKQEVG